MTSGLPTSRSIDEIRGYHAHVYFDAATRGDAMIVRDEIARFDVELGRIWDEPRGPHTVPMYQVAFGVAALPQVLPWLMLNRRGLSVLVHPCTADEIADHTINPLWLGTPLPLDIERLRRLLAEPPAT